MSIHICSAVGNLCRSVNNDSRRMRTLRLLLICVSAIVFTAIASGQLTVDATSTLRQRKREPTRGHGGSNGFKLPLRVGIRTTGSPPDENGLTVVEFTLTNSGKKDVTFPISANPGDLEPSDPKAAYTLITLGLHIGLSKKPVLILPGGAELYGSAKFPGTLVRVVPGDSIRVLTKIGLPESGGPNADTFVGSASWATKLSNR